IDFAAAMAQTADSTGLSLDWDGSEDALFRVPNHPSQDGNTVEVGVEQALFSQNASDFQMSMTFVSMKISGLKSAIKGE
ncbi:MAG: flagellar basal-body rod protein FlgB, partial [Comamonas sp.]|nr:flagellar basal-body rod protein FlgB [Candidatus Comamonas equi]